MTNVTVLTERGRFSLPAEPIGPFAIHRMLLSAERRVMSDRWTLTHRPTGASVLQGICCEESARRLAAALLEKGLDWDFREVNIRGKRVVSPKQVWAAKELIASWPKRCELCR